MNILLCLNKKFLNLMISLIRSIIDNNDGELNFYIISKDISKFDLDYIRKYFKRNITMFLIDIDDDILKDAPVSERYPIEIYYRIFASYFLPKNIDRVLYLDCDIIVKGNLNELYNMDFKNNLYIGTTNVKEFLKKINQIKNKAPKDSEYLNTGVLLMNLELLRKEQNYDEVLNYIKNRNKFFTLPDQDIISTLYGNRVIIVSNLIYNLSDRAIIKHNLSEIDLKKKININWVEENTIIIHYYGKNKPWKDNYHGILKEYYDKYRVDFL